MIDTNILEKLMSYCAYTERCHQDVIQKQYLLGVPIDEHDIYLAELIEQNFLNESRFVELFIRSKFNQKKWGRRKITQQLLIKGISQQQIDRCMEQAIDNNIYKEVLTQLVQQKLDQLNARLSTFEKRKKIYQHLQQKGFENYEILPILDLLIQ